MAEETNIEEQEVEAQEFEGEEVEEKEEKIDEPKIMCFVSKQMVPISQTVEVEYMAHKTVRVLPQYIKYSEAGA